MTITGANDADFGAVLVVSVEIVVVVVSVDFVPPLLRPCLGFVDS